MTPRLCPTCGRNRIPYAKRSECYDCLPKRKPTLCAGCGRNPVAYPGRTHCYDCRPKHPGWAAPRCRRCGATTHYYTGGICRRCHRLAGWVDSCRDCLAWGVTQRNDWRCQGCRGLYKRLGIIAVCPSCRRTVPVNRRGYCRLCCRQANFVRPRHYSVDIAWANRHGQQLFLADLFRQKRPDPPPAPPPPIPPPGVYPMPHRQLTLFDLKRDLPAGRDTLPYPPLPDLLALIEQTVRDHARRHGWGDGLIDRTRYGLRVLLATQDTPGAPVKATAAAGLASLKGFNNVQPVLEVLAAADMLDDDRPPVIDAWFARRTAHIPAAMRDEIGVWFLAMRDGSTRPPRSHPRDPETIRSLVRGVLPALETWAAAGHASLREITKADVRAVLPGPVHRHLKTLGALRALFRYLRARRLVFTNPTARLRGPLPQATPPLPLDPALVREALTSANPAQAALAALVGFHALRVCDLRALQLTDLHDARLHLPGRIVVLAPPVRERLARWLDERARRWPGTSNPHVFVNFQTAVRTTAVSRPWITFTLGVSTQALREDRILDEALASHGDVRLLSDMFGLTVGGAERYIHTTDQPSADPAAGTGACE